MLKERKKSDEKVKEDVKNRIDGKVNLCRQSGV
jgi:hypothetical protein